METSSDLSSGKEAKGSNEGDHIISQTKDTPVDERDVDMTDVATSMKRKRSTPDSTDAQEENLNLPWVEKYRPKSLEDLVAHDDIINILTKLIESNKLPHLLFYGPPGTGKTSTIIAAAKKMYGSKAYASMALELNASDSRGIDVVRNEIKEFAGTKQLFSKGVKLIILDEADSMTTDAQNALRRVIEKYTKNARFCLIGNYVSKIIPALQSRCTRFRFAPLSPTQIHGRLEEIAKTEMVNYTENGLQAILSLSGGDMRRVLNLLQTTAMSSQEVNEMTVYETSGSPQPADLESISHSLLNDDFSAAQEKIRSLCRMKGYAMMDIISDLTTIVTSMELPPGAMAMILDGMSGVEYRLASGTDEDIQCASLVGVWLKARHFITV